MIRESAGGQEGAAAPRGDLIFDKYEPVRRLAVGGMGEIFLANQVGVPGFERLVVLKNLLPHLASNPAFVEQFLDEARVAALLNHPNVISIYDVGAWRGTYYIAMEYVPGVDIATLLTHCHNTSEHLSFTVVARIGLAVAAGLDYAHHARSSNGAPLHVVHRDISPQNIMVRHDGVTKIVDFGIARAANRFTKTETGEIKGKIAYLAPEQLAGDDVDARADQYSLGVVLWEMLARRRMFAGRNEQQALKLIIDRVYPPLQDVRADVPERLREAVERMLEPDPARRYERCGQAAEALGDYLASVNHRSESELADLAAHVAHATGKVKNLGTGTEQLQGSAPLSPAQRPDSPGHVRASNRRSRPRFALAGLAIMVALVTTLATAVVLRERASQVVSPPSTAPPIVSVPPTAPAPAIEAPTSQERPPEHTRRKVRAPEVGTGFLTVRTVPATQVLIDDVARGVTPLYKLELHAGTHRLSFVNRAAAIDVKRSVKITTGETTKLDLVLDQRASEP